MTDTTTEAFTILGREINLESPKQVREALFNQLQLPPTRHTSSGPSVSTPALQDLLQQTGHPFVAALLRHRRHDLSQEGER